MKKPWSISTTVRNPDRIRGFLELVGKIEGKKWDRDNQKKFQIILIQYKLYGYGKQQFLNGLSEKHLNLMNTSDPISYSEAEAILESKNYVGGGDMRGRQSFKPLVKMGLAYIDKNNKIKISDYGKYFLKKDFDIGEFFFRSFLKWQLPNLDSRGFRKEDGFNIKPFIGTLHLISKVNKKWAKLGEEPKGLRKYEFFLFAPTLIDYNEIDNTAQEIINLRIKLKKIKTDKKEYIKEFSHEFIKKFLNSEDSDLIKRTLDNLKTYSDNIIRYFRFTRYIYLRGNGYAIDLEPRRSIEIKSLLNSDSAKPLEFDNRGDYINYITDINLPILPWDKKPELIKIVKVIIDEINKLELILSITEFKEKDYLRFNVSELNTYIQKLRDLRRTLQERINYEKSQDLTKVKEYIDILKEKIYGMERSPLVLEKYVTLGLNALNDALEIKPNYPVGDDNEPTNTAPAGVPDIEGYYVKYNSICEVTMLKDRSQWFNEGQPVMRHLRDFEEKNPEKETYCLFIAPTIHRDTINTFWNSVKNGYEGQKQKIIPISIKQFVILLETFVNLKANKKDFTHEQLFGLYDDIVNLDDVDSSINWIEIIPNKIENWKKKVSA